MWIPPIAGWLIIGHPIEIDDSGVSPFSGNLHMGGFVTLIYEHAGFMYLWKSIGGLKCCVSVCIYVYVYGLLKWIFPLFFV